MLVMEKVRPSWASLTPSALAQSIPGSSFVSSIACHWPLQWSLVEVWNVLDLKDKFSYEKFWEIKEKPEVKLQC